MFIKSTIIVAATTLSLTATEARALSNVSRVNCNSHTYVLQYHSTDRYSGDRFYRIRDRRGRILQRIRSRSDHQATRYMERRYCQTSVESQIFQQLLFLGTHGSVRDKSRHRGRRPGDIDIERQGIRKRQGRGHHRNDWPGYHKKRNSHKNGRW